MRRLTLPRTPSKAGADPIDIGAVEAETLRGEERRPGRAGSAVPRPITDAPLSATRRRDGAASRGHVMMMTSVRATAEERSRSFPGDALLDEPTAIWTHGVTIAAPPRAVWPWLAQMGAGRAGWYSWDRLDNGGRRSAEEILPELGRIAVGDVLPALPGVKDAFLVDRLEPGRDLVLGLAGDGGGRRGTWEFLLDPLPPEGTRLLVRVRVGGGGRMVLAFWRPIHRVMQARQLRGLRRRAEARRRAATGPVMPLQGERKPAAWAVGGGRMARILRAENGMNIVGQGARIMLFTGPALAGAILTHLFRPGLLALPWEGRFLGSMGAAMVLAGAVLWGAALGQLLSGFPRGKLVTSGAYGVCRNPIYASVALLVLPGLSLVSGTWGYLVAAAALLLGVALFISKEERDLAGVFGEEYRRYTARVHRILPFVRPKRRVPAAPARREGRVEVFGEVSPGFEGVREVFAENFSRRQELGGACCAYLGGEKVVDLWGGLRNRETGEPWERETMVLVYSATKGLSAMALALAHSRGWLDYEERVCTYWPEFAQHGKDRITVRQLLAHQAGLFAFDEPVDRDVVADLDRLAAVMARQRPAWPAGERQAYHVISLGFYEGELLRRIDPRHRTLGQFFQEEIATPLGIDFYIRLPESIPDSRLADLALASPLAMLAGLPPRFILSMMNRRSVLFRAGAVNPGTELPRDPRRIYARDLEVPSGGGVGTARAIARAYGAFATGGAELGLRPQTLRALAAPAVPPARGFHDECVKGPVQFSLGFMKPSEAVPFGMTPAAFGAPGSGGSMGFGDPEIGLGYGYVTSQSGTKLDGDPRDVALREAIISALRRRAR
jgi:CubicO group peptidase (beta-lactamase class C family)/protein-S-isoprenylcysteine O-methyltransferase Ste14